MSQDHIDQGAVQKFHLFVKVKAASLIVVKINPNFKVDIELRFQSYKTYSLGIVKLILVVQFICHTLIMLIFPIFD